MPDGPESRLGRPLWDLGRACYAHTPPLGGDWHYFAHHARAVGELAGEFAEPFGAKSLATFLGYTHDAGKLVHAVQVALRERAVDHGRRLGVPHKDEGAALAWLLFQSDPTLGFVGHLANYGHHGGIPARAGATVTDLSYMRANPDFLDELIGMLGGQLGLDIRAAATGVEAPVFLQQPDRVRRHLVMDVFARMVHSALVDADFLDTAAHFAGHPEARRHTARGMRQIRDVFMSWYHQRYASAAESSVNQSRRQVFQSCVGAALDPVAARGKRIYRLSAPTGSGKTMAAAAFAVNHAAAFSKRRVIVAVPFTSITTQNAREYREAFTALGPDVVLEHHSNVAEPGTEDSWRRLSAENWDAEFIVTTTVQLFESLFSGRPAAARKLHRIAGSVLVLDEVQSLPMVLVPAILSMLQELVANYGVTVLLASATQPTFWDLRVWQDLAAPLDIVPRAVPDVSRLTTFEVRSRQQSWDEVAEELAQLPCMLAIVNTTSDAQQLHAAVAARVSDGPVWHLSTRMCAQHRQDVLEEVRGRLAAAEPVRLISTQLIEAGVDVDFPVVYRAMAPADSLVQSAGRCNREGRLGRHGGRVIVFESAGQHTPPGLYRSGVNWTRKLFQGPDALALGESTAMDRYYSGLFRQRVEGADQWREVQQARQELDFPEVARRFRMIEDRNADVVIDCYGPPEQRGQLLELLAALESDPRRVLASPDRQLLARYSASVPASARDRWGLKIAPGVWLWPTEDYDPSCGVLLHNSASIW